MFEIVPGVFALGGREILGPGSQACTGILPARERALPHPALPRPCCIQYLLDLGLGVLINAGGGPDWQELRQELSAAGRAGSSIGVLLLLSAHVHHAGAAARLKADLGCEVVAGAPDAELLAAPDAQRTGADRYARTPARVEARPVEEDGHVLRLPRGELVLLRVPGITEGSLAAWIDLGTPPLRLLFAQVHWFTGWNKGFSVDRHLDALRRLLLLEADILCDGQLGVHRGKDAVREFIKAHLDALAMSRAQGKSVEQWKRSHPMDSFDP